MYEYNAKLIRVKDGDSLVLEIDYGMYQKGEWDFRIEGVDTPEIFGRASEEEKAAGQLAKTFVKETLKKNGPTLRVQTLKKSKYDYLVRIFVDVDSNGVPLGADHRVRKFVEDPEVAGYPRRLTLTDLIIAYGHGLPYEGEKKRSWEVRKPLLEAARKKYLA